MRRRVLEAPLGLWVDPASAYRALHGDDDCAFWLDCGPGATQGISAMGRGSALLTDSVEAPILQSLRAGLDEAADLGSSAAPGFRLGWVGWFTYEFGAQTLGETRNAAAKHPDAVMILVEQAVIFDHAAGTVTLLALGDEWSGSAAQWRDETMRMLRAAATAPPPPATHSPFSAPVVWAHSDSRYLQMIEDCRDAIREGEAYQLCLTTSARVDCRPDPVAAYLALRASSPSHHGGLLRCGDIAVLSASPEQFLAVEPGGVVETRPIKGTRPRGSSSAADARLARELRESGKEQAENLMIVDLMRNDLSRVCQLGSVEVTSLLAVESYPHVHQLVSTVRGRLRPGLDALDALEACFPAGSMTGAPKRAATSILARLEGRPRGIYSGVFGYLGFDGRLDLAMIIRTIVIDHDGATVGAGGGITALSDAREELAEVKLKAAALLRVLVGPDRREGDPRSKLARSVSG